MKRIVTIVGARPQFIKASALSRAIRATEGLEEVMVHTGQHYDPSLSSVFFRELDMPPPRHELHVGSGTHGAQTGEMLRSIEAVLLDERPAAVVVYGDTNSTLAGALAAAKLGIVVAHVEAGLRSFNRAMPEEINRVLTDHVSSLLLCPTTDAVENLAREGITRGVHVVGDVMFDVAVSVAKRAAAPSFAHAIPLSQRNYVLATIHRAENTDDAERLASIARALVQLAARRPVVFPVHPRTRRRLTEFGIELGSVHAVDPVGLLEMTWLERNAAVIVTDSGGVQKEAYFHRTPCVTVRTETEWVETIRAGWNRLASPEDTTAIVRAVEEASAGGLPEGRIEEYGEGDAAERVVQLLRGA
jgi:UDP-GlcNAc3NAcA epimerase